MSVYCLPNDEVGTFPSVTRRLKLCQLTRFRPAQLEQERLDLTHVLLTMAIGDKLFLAPINPSKIGRVLDIGTGTGICMSPRWQLCFSADS